MSGKKQQQKKGEPVTGGWSRIHNLNDSHVQEIAEFAVNEYNKEHKAHLKLGGIINGEQQVVAGVNYRLTLTTKDETETSKKCIAVVWEKTWENFKQLTSFTEV